MDVAAVVMSVAKSLSEEQVAQIQSWADEGARLSDIQRRLAEEMEIRVTYMEMRFLIDDLKIRMPEDEKPEKPEEPESPPESGENGKATAGDSADDTVETGESEPAKGGKVSVTISELQRPGAMVSGSVTFAGGETADWWMDPMGRLGMDPRNPEFRPSESEMMEFQTELHAVAKKKGF